MGRRDFKFGHANVDDLLYWMDERHAIYERRFIDQYPPPWSTDPIFVAYKFTNVFRELDKGTIELRRLVRPAEVVDTTTAKLAIFNIIWYRMFNRFEHAKAIGFCHTIEELESAVGGCAARGEKMFTSAHMTWGRADEPKWKTTLSTMRMVFEDLDKLLRRFIALNEIQNVFYTLREMRYPGIGPFLAYEIASDLRHYPYFNLTKDVFSWANIGPGCSRGLRRLGREPNLLALRDLFSEICPARLSPRLIAHWMLREDPPFELRELEHSLCEFDKYQRVATGAGAPRERFHGGH
jgi:hypothetical protein